MKNESIINLYKEKDFCMNLERNEVLLSPLPLLYRHTSRDSSHMTRVSAKCSSRDNMTYTYFSCRNSCLLIWQYSIW